MILTPSQIDALEPHLLGCGYASDHLVRSVPTPGGYSVPLAAFAHAPHDTRSACIAFVDAVAQEIGPVECRALGAPVVLARQTGFWELWKQKPQAPELIERISDEHLPAFFRAERSKLTPEAIYRAKTWGRFDRSYHLDFVDLGLMPLVEQDAGRKLSDLIMHTITGIKARLRWDDVTPEQGQWLIQKSFWLLAAKILRDKAVPSFSDVDLRDPGQVFTAVARHYGSTSPVELSSPARSEALLDAARAISAFSHLGMVSTDALSYLYENTLISKETRSQLGTHSTPPYLVDYMLGRLRPWIEKIPFEERTVFEPACGHAAFLLAAMTELGDMLPEGTSPSERHRYLRERLHGCDIDSFALEIARLRLTLADVPNPDGWDLRTGDVFSEDLVESLAGTATIILANPPFEDFPSQVVHRAGPGQQVNKAAELLRRFIQAARPGSIFGFGVPQGFLHSKNAEPVRRSLASEFELLEILLLPDRVFEFSDSESAVLLGRRLGSAPQERHPVHYRRVREWHLDEFRQSYRISQGKEIEHSRFAEPGSSFLVPELEEVWEFCRNLPWFEAVADIGQGFQFRSRTDLLFPPGAVTEAITPQHGLVAGFSRMDRRLLTHRLPEVAWFNMDLGVISRPRSGTVLGRPQVLLNYAPVSRGPWRLKAFLDRDGLAASSNFLTIRPKGKRLPVEILWAICNSPFANAYVYCQSGKRHVLAGRMREMPIPDIHAMDIGPLLGAVGAYLHAVRPAIDFPTPQAEPEQLRILHWRIDAEVLRLYGLPAHLERQLLDLFGGFKRQGVPFTQTGYFPPDYSEPLSLRELLAITEDWDQTNDRRMDLIDKKIARATSPAESAELANLQRLTDARVRLVAPLPFAEIEALRDQLKRRGIWEGE
jgi:hypothetical protein